MIAQELSPSLVAKEGSNLVDSRFVRLSHTQITTGDPPDSCYLLPVDEPCRFDNQQSMFRPPYRYRQILGRFPEVMLHLRLGMLPLLELDSWDNR